MKPASPSGRRDKPAAPQPAARKTPNSDMEGEDVGTTDSSTAHQEQDSATAATRAMKQTSKTTAESSGKKKR